MGLLDNLSEGDPVLINETLYYTYHVSIVGSES